MLDVGLLDVGLRHEERQVWERGSGRVLGRRHDVIGNSLQGSLESSFLCAGWKDEGANEWFRAP